ncbi:hypothetical protein FRC01_003258 [Tulasnella sp. 417]|nr:hypothetical protein FRC01_003258 [Tulasnella sp. 417]
MSVNKGDVLVIPAPSDKTKNDSSKIKIHWRQQFRQRYGDYYLLVAKNKTQGDSQVPIYIQSDLYNEQDFNSTSGTRKIDADHYELTIDDRHQYAGKPEGRFVVWHDKEREPFSDNFLQSSLVKQDTGLVKQLFQLLGLGLSAIEVIGEMAQSSIGTYLETF